MRRGQLRQDGERRQTERPAVPPPPVVIQPPHVGVHGAHVRRQHERFRLNRRGDRICDRRGNEEKPRCDRARRSGLRRQHIRRQSHHQQQRPERQHPRDHSTDLLVEPHHSISDRDQVGVERKFRFDIPRPIATPVDLRIQDSHAVAGEVPRDAANIRLSPRPVRMTIDRPADMHAEGDRAHQHHGEHAQAKPRGGALALGRARRDQVVALAVRCSCGRRGSHGSRRR